jgi:group II intron reverse transcriptase/maturase
LRLSSREEFISRNSHVEDNKPDTPKRLQITEYILSRIRRYISSLPCFNGTSKTSSQKARRSSPIGSYKSEQAAKTIWTINTTHCQLRDSTASNLIMRKRSFHNSACTKGSSKDTPTQKTLDCNLKKPVRKVKPIKVAKRVGVTTIVSKELEQYRKPGQKYYNLIKIISDPIFLVTCYEEIAKKKGNMTPGSDSYTLDGLNWKWFVQTADSLKNGKYNFKPNRRVYIPKTDGSKRPLSVSSPRDKIVQKSLHAILESIFESLFLPNSHGYRPNKSVHSALLRLYLVGSRHNWVIQGDITKCFDTIPHNIIMSHISKHVGDPRIIELIKKFLRAGYLEPDLNKTLVRSQYGTPPHVGGVLSPLLMNIVLNELDKFISNYEKKFRKGIKRRMNPVYKKLAVQRSNSNDPVERWRLLKEMRITRRTLAKDPNRMEYIRYADDFIVLISGTLKDANYIQSLIKDFLKSNCGLELNMDKTVITNLLDSK